MKTNLNVDYNELSTEQLKELLQRYADSFLLNIILDDDFRQLFEKYYGKYADEIVETIKVLNEIIKARILNELKKEEADENHEDR